jgi:hypothetical protein
MVLPYAVHVLAVSPVLSKIQLVIVEQRRRGPLKRFYSGARNDGALHALRQQLRATIC